MFPYSHLYLILWVIFIGYWLVNWNGNKRTVRQASSAPRIVLAIVVVWLVFNRRGLPEDWRRVVLPHTDAAEIAGLLICASGVAVAIWARRTLGTNWSATPTIKEGHELVEAGPYRFVRHPIYTGILLAVLGSALGGGRPVDAVVLVVCAVTFGFRVKTEESLMLQQFPQAYPEYMKRTKALIPYLF